MHRAKQRTTHEAASSTASPRQPDGSDDETKFLIRALTADCRVNLDNLSVANVNVGEIPTPPIDFDADRAPRAPPAEGAEHSLPKVKVRILGWSRRGVTLLFVFSILYEDTRREVWISKEQLLMSFCRLQSMYPRLPVPEFAGHVARLEDKVTTDVHITAAAKAIEAAISRFLELPQVAPYVHEIVSLLFIQPEFVEFIPRMNILILVVGTRGDVQPFLALAQKLNTIGHRCRLATHANFKVGS
jgi:hypothetical protein